MKTLTTLKTPKVFTTVTQAGLDNHRTFGALTARDGQGKIVTRMRLDYRDRQVLGRQLAQLPPKTPVIVEGSFGWGWLCDEVAQRGLSPHLASASKVSAMRVAKGMAKSNRIDGDVLSELEMHKRWWEVWLAPKEVRDQRELLRYRMGLVESQTATKLRIHATLHRHGIIQENSDLFGVGGRQFLEQLIHKDDVTLREMTKITLAGQLRLLDQLRKQIAQVTRLFRKHLIHDPVGEILRTIPGIGIILAYTIVAEVGRFDRFPNARHLCSYACLVPIAHDSGEDDGSAPLGRHVGYAGRRTLKWAFIEAAHGAVKKDKYFRDIFNRRTNDGQRDRNRGYITVGHHLCQVAYSCVKQARDYRPGKSPNNPPGKNDGAGAPDQGSRPSQTGEESHGFELPSKKKKMNGKETLLNATKEKRGTKKN